MLVVASVCCVVSASSKKKKQGKSWFGTTEAKEDVVDAVKIADSRYEKLAFREGGSKVECFRWGERVNEMDPEECHAGPPFWGWWNQFRNCAVTNACLYRNKLTLYSASCGGVLPSLLPALAVFGDDRRSRLDSFS